MEADENGCIAYRPTMFVGVTEKMRYSCSCDILCGKRLVLKVCFDSSSALRRRFLHCATSPEYFLAGNEQIVESLMVMC